MEDNRQLVILVAYIKSDNVSRSTFDNMKSYMQNSMNDNFKNLKNENIKWFILPSDRTEIKCIYPNVNSNINDPIIDFYDTLINYKYDNISKRNINHILRKIKIKRLLKI